MSSNTNVFKHGIKNFLLSHFFKAVLNLRISIEQTMEQLRSSSQEGHPIPRNHQKSAQTLLAQKKKTLMHLLSCVMSVHGRAESLDLVKDLKMHEEDVYIIHYLDKLLEEMQ